MARRTRASRRIQRPKSALPARIERALNQLADDAAAALIYMSGNEGR